MAYYNANLMIGLTRKALGVTQEKLSEGICAVETYSRIENGHHSVKKSTYQKLMKKMGRTAETRYTICMAQDGMLLEERTELERAFKRYDYEAAERYLQEMREKADGNLLTMQYVEKEQAFVDYRKAKISAEQLLAKLDVVMCMTTPDYKSYLLEKKVFPFLKQELLILMNMGNAYGKLGEWKKSVEMYQAVLRCLDANYMGNPDKTTLEITVRNGISMVYETEGKNQEALGEIEKCLKLSKKCDCGHLMATLLSAKAFNIVKLVDKENMPKTAMNEAKNLSQQAYYIATARGDINAAKSVANYHKKLWGDIKIC